MSTEIVSNQALEPEGHEFYLKGTFSTLTTVTLGFGATKRRSVSKVYWYVEQVDDKAYRVQKLNNNNVPSEEKRTISEEEFLKKFEPEINYYTMKVLPAMRKLGDTLQRGDQYREDGHLYSAEVEYDEALEMDEQNVRATFGLGLVQLERGDKEKAKIFFERMVEMEATFQPEHKHMFNEFGIQLRKSNMFEEALLYYFRAVEMASPDENLYFNIARVYYEKGDFPGCIKYLTICLETGQGVEEAVNFCRHLIAQSEDPDGFDIMGAMTKQLGRDAGAELRKLQDAAGVDPDEAEAIRAKVRAKAERAARLQRKRIREAQINVDQDQPQEKTVEPEPSAAPADIASLDMDMLA